MLTFPDNPVNIVGLVAITAILFLRMSMNDPASSSVATKLPPAVAVPTFKSLLRTSLGTRIPFAGFSYFLEAASDTSLSKAAASCAARSVGFASAFNALKKENRLTSVSYTHLTLPTIYSV